MSFKKKAVRYFDSQEESTPPTSTKKSGVNKSKQNFKAKKLKTTNIPKTKLQQKDEPPAKPSPYNLANIKTGVHKKRIESKGNKINYLKDLAEDSKVLLIENKGYLEADEGETTTQFTQKQIARSVDITAASKQFELHLREFGPYRAKYTRNGRHLLLAGRQGHVAAFDWVTKRLHCELNVMESTHDVAWLHIETMFAVAQKKWVFIYDNQGVELHCIKKLHNVSRMEFLPYHFLLATANTDGYLGWLDISIGQLVTQYNTKLGRLSHLAQNPYNAVLCVGHAKGVVSMWTPNVREPVAKLLCHKAPISALHVDPSGTYLVTAGSERSLKIWDVRKLQGPLQNYSLNSNASNVAMSQQNLLAVGMGNIVEVYNDCVHTKAKKAYLMHKFNNSVENFAFCPYEDVLGVGTEKGFSSLLIPGAGEANFDGFEANPFQTKSQRREHEVKSLLEKIQPDLISLNPNIINEIDVSALNDKIESRKKYFKAKGKKPYVPPPKKGVKTKVKKARVVMNSGDIQLD